MTYSDHITYVLFTFNEEARVRRAILNLREGGEVLVVDNHSTDRTREIAAELGAHILLHANPGWVEDEGTTVKVLSNVRTPWIYWAYADEFLEPRTIDFISATTASDDYDVLTLSRRNYYYGTDCRDAYAGGWLPRIFRKNAIDFSGNTIHNFGSIVVPDARVLHIDRRDHFVYHLISNTAASYLRSYDRYTDIEAREKKPPFRSSSTLLWRLARTFVRNYFGRRGYQAGLDGLFFALQMTYFDALLAMKSYEIDQQYDLAGIERKNNAVRDAILARQGIAVDVLMGL